MAFSPNEHFIYMRLCIRQHPSIQFIHHQKFKKLPFLLFLPLNFIPIPHISRYINQPDFLLQFYSVHTHSQSKNALVFLSTRIYLLVVYRNHYLLFVRQTKANACSRGISDNQWLCFTCTLPCDMLGCACLCVWTVGRVFFYAFLYFVSLSYTNNKMYV